MLEFDTKLKKWGNSFRVIIPKEELKRSGIKESQEIHVVVMEKSNALKESFGMLKDKRTMSGQQAKDKIRKELHKYS